MSLQEMYQLECYENAIKQENKESNRDGAFKYNHVTYYQYIEDTGRQLNKMRILEGTEITENKTYDHQK